MSFKSDNKSHDNNVDNYGEDGSNLTMTIMIMIVVIAILARVMIIFCYIV